MPKITLDEFYMPRRLQTGLSESGKLCHIIFSDGLDLGIVKSYRITPNQFPWTENGWYIETNSDIGFRIEAFKQGNVYHNVYWCYVKENDAWRKMRYDDASESAGIFWYGKSGYCPLFYIPTPLSFCDDASAYLEYMDVLHENF